MKYITKYNFKRYIIVFLLLCIYILFSTFSYVNAISNNIESSVFRLHVIANSNSEEDQNLKYIVRDNILNYINKISVNSSNKDEIILLVKQNIKEIENIAQTTIYKNGYTYKVSVEIGNFAFPTKNYGDITFPPGFYDALKIQIGNAEGQNWWCVMFPPLCFIDVSSGIVPEESQKTLKENLSYEEFDLISNSNSGKTFKFKLVELFQNIGVKLAQS